jgi:hypothetical protein
MTVARSCNALAVAVVSAIAIPSAAQSAPDLSGTWVLNVVKSQMGGAPLRSATSVVTRVGNTYHIMTISDAEAGRVADTLIVPATDGESTNLIRGVQIHSILAYKGDTNVTTSEFRMNGRIVGENTSRALISTDRHTMTKVSDYHPAFGEPIHDVMVYERE